MGPSPAISKADKECSVRHLAFSPNTGASLRPWCWGGAAWSQGPRAPSALAVSLPVFFASPFSSCLPQCLRPFQIHLLYWATVLLLVWEQDSIPWPQQTCRKFLWALILTLHVDHVGCIFFEPNLGMILRTTTVRAFWCAEVLNELHVDILDYIESISVQAGRVDLENVTE